MRKRHGAEVRHDYETLSDARTGLRRYFPFYNDEGFYFLGRLGDRLKSVLQDWVYGAISRLTLKRACQQGRLRIMDRVIPPALTGQQQ